jgi:hypothetical protein
MFVIKVFRKVFASKEDEVLSSGSTYFVTTVRIIKGILNCFKFSSCTVCQNLSQMLLTCWSFLSVCAQFCILHLVWQ